VIGDDNPVTPSGAGVRVAIKVMPRSPKNAVAGVREGRLLVRVTAPPVDSAANEAVVTLLAEALGVPKRDVTVVSGRASRNKSIGVARISAGNARSKLAI
jgi:uncharacterized protein (TIGR00251 family)